jgi:hypothetical protein
MNALSIRPFINQGHPNAKAVRWSEALGRESEDLFEFPAEMGFSGKMQLSCGGLT